MSVIRSRLGRLSSQIFAAQLVILAATVLIGFLLLVRTERANLDRQFELRAASIAEATAGVPRIRACLADVQPGCTARVQDITSRIQHETGASYVVVIDMHRVRHSHPDPRLIGKKVAEPLVAADGRVHTGIDNGSTGRSANGKAPLRGFNGAIVGEVSAGIRESSVSSALRGEVPSYAIWLGIALILGAVASWVLARILKRRTFGLELDDISSLLQEREATLHGIHEGVIAFDGHGHVTMVNDPAQQLLGLDTAAVGRALEDVMPAGRLRDVLLGVGTRPDHLVLTDDHALVVNRRPVILAGRPHGAVVTLRDRTEMAALMRELDGERGLIESLRAQHHEFSNRMHVIAGLLELGHADDARDYLMEIQGTAAELDNSLRASIASPQVVGLLLGKAAEASERGIRLEITPETWLSESPVKIQVLTLVLGNLVDNAMDAVAAAPQGGRVEIGILEDEEAITIVVTDNGPGVAPELVPRIFLDGYSTKGHQGGSLRGLGLALVHRMVTHSDGSVQVTRAKTGGARFTVVIPKRQARRESTSNAKVPAR